MPFPNSGDTGGDERRPAMTAGVPAGGEFAIIDRLKHRLPGPPAGEVWIGDDAAVVGPAPATGPCSPPT